MFNTSKIAGVVLRGTYFSRADLEEMLAEAEQRANPQLGAANATKLQTVQ